MTQIDQPRDHLIRKGNHYYRANRSGYTQSITAAGRYTKAEAEREAAVEPWHMEAVAVSSLFSGASPGQRHFKRIRHVRDGEVSITLNDMEYVMPESEAMALSAMILVALQGDAEAPDTRAPAHDFGAGVSS